LSFDELEELEIVFARIFAISGNAWNVLGLRSLLELKQEPIDSLEKKSKAYSRIFPVKIDAVELMFFNEVDHVISQSPMHVSNPEQYMLRRHASVTH